MPGSYGQYCSLCSGKAKHGQSTKSNATSPEGEQLLTSAQMPLGAVRQPMLRAYVRTQEEESRQNNHTAHRTLFQKSVNNKRATDQQSKAARAACQQNMCTRLVGLTNYVARLRSINLWCAFICVQEEGEVNVPKMRRNPHPEENRKNAILQNKRRGMISPIP